MKISDAKKEIEIELTGTSHNNAMILAVFTMNISRPFQASARFDVHDIVTEKGHTGIRFSQYTEIGKAFHAKNQSVLITLPEDAIQWIRTESENHIARLKEEADAKKATVWHWNNDNEYYALHIFPDISMDFRDDLRKIQNTLQKNQMMIWDALVANSRPAEKQSWMHDNTTWMEVPAEIVEQLAQDIVDAKNTKTQARKAEYVAKEADAFQKAREAGEKVIIRKWTVPCEDEEEECSTDIVVEYAMPDGSKKIEQHHTW